MQSEKAIGNGYHLQLMNGVLFVILFASAAYQLSQWHYISLLYEPSHRESRCPDYT